MRSIAHLTLAFATAFASVLALPSIAQDLPGRVGRIAHIEGTAAIYQEPDEGWERAYVNSPISTENSVWTEPSSRADVRVGGTAIRMEEATQLDISRLDENELDAFVPRGTVAIRVRHFDRNDRVIFNTPHARFSIRANGRYRVDVDPEREESRLTVFTGEARVGSDSGRIRVQAGKTVRVFGGSAPSYVVETAFRDPFDQWSERRDSGWVESRSLKYVSASMTGYEDLDRYGSWREEPEFGALWYPTRVAADWAPYRDGRWDYVRPWGWTWVDDAPWGYAPFHYGRWVFVRDRWAWTPGRREVRPTWAPALVAWVGGSNFSVGVSSSNQNPSVGWYPLSPWERYQPWYNASPTYVNQVNIIVRESPQREDRRQWAESSRERGITVVNRNVLIDRRPVQQAIIAVRPEVARQVQIAAPATVLPPRSEVIQRRQSVRTQVVAPIPAASAPAAAPGSAPATQRPGPAQAQPTQRGERAGPVARPEFQRRQAVAAPPPEPAKTAPPPVQRVTPPSAAAQQQAREQVSKARDAEAQKAREDQQKARDEQQKAGAAPPRTAAEPAKPADDPRSREAEQQKARELQQKAAEDQRRTRDEQVKGREADQQKAREQQQKGAEDQRKARDDQLKGREAEQQKAREDQMKARDAEQQKAREQQQQQQQKAGEDQRKAREDQMRGRDAEQQKAREQQQQQQQQQQKAVDDQRKARDDQMKGREAEQQKMREQQQQQQQQQQQKAVEDQRKARDDQMKGREAEQQKAREQQQQQQQQQQKAGEDQRKAREEQVKGREAEQQKAREDQMKARAEQQKAREEQMKGRGEPQQQREPQQRQPQQQPQGAAPAPPDADARLTPQERALKRQERDKKAREDKEEEEKKGKAGR